MVGRSRHEQLDRVIEEVARGDRELFSIRDAAQREAVRIALRLHRSAAEPPDAYARIRMRARVMGRLDARRPTLGDHAWAALELAARPAPLIMRGIAIASVLVCLGMGAIAASADTLPGDILYPVKLSAEAARLALADCAGDRAVIETSIAGHRLDEAERLATSGRATDALVASAMYSQNIASAAADLAADPSSDLARQLEVRFDSDRVRARTLATQLSSDATGARAAHVLEIIAQPIVVPGDTGMVRVASTAVGIAEQLVRAAEQTVSEANAAVAPDDVTSTVGPHAAPSSAATATAATAATAHRAAESGSVGPQKANETLKTVKKAAEETRAAAERAKSHHR